LYFWFWFIRRGHTCTSDFVLFGEDILVLL